MGFFDDGTGHRLTLTRADILRRVPSARVRGVLGSSSIPSDRRDAGPGLKQLGSLVRQMGLKDLVQTSLQVRRDIKRRRK